MDEEFVRGFIRMCLQGYNLGWHECHGGNLSYRLNKEDVEAVSEEIKIEGRSIRLPVEVPSLANEYFLVTGSGKFMSNAEIDPYNSMGIIRIDSDGKGYQIVWGFANGGKPTSELSTHLLNHAVKKAIAGEKYRVIYHAHPENTIALSFVLPVDDRIYTQQLWKIEPECAMIFPGGIGVLPWMIPGTAEIAKLTCRKMEQYDVIIWAQHGVFAAGDSYDNTFGLMHTVEKSASILLKIKSVGGTTEIPTTEQIRELAEVFHLDLPERFL